MKATSLFCEVFFQQLVSCFPTTSRSQVGKGFEAEQQVKYVLPWGMLLEANSLLGLGKRWKEPTDPHSQGSRRPRYLCCLYASDREKQESRVSTCQGGFKKTSASWRSESWKRQSVTNALKVHKDLPAFLWRFCKKKISQPFIGVFMPSFLEAVRGKTESKANTSWTFTVTRYC